MKTTVKSNFKFNGIGKGLNGFFIKLFGSPSEKFALDLIANLDCNVEYSVEMTAEEYSSLSDKTRKEYQEDLNNLGSDLSKIVKGIKQGFSEAIDAYGEEYQHFQNIDFDTEKFDKELLKKRESIFGKDCNSSKKRREEKESKTE